MLASLRDFVRRVAPGRLGERGVAAIETAIAIPLFAVLLIGVAEVGSQILTRHSLNATATRIGDLVTQQEMLTQAGLNDIFDAVEHIAGRTYGDQGVVIVTAVTGVDGVPKVAWQERGAGTLDEQSQVGAAGAAAKLPGDFTVADGETVIVVEVLFTNAGVLPDVMPRTIMSKTSLHRGRVNDLGTLSSG